MNESVEIDSAEVIAAMTPPQSKAGFNRATLVVRGVDGKLLQAQTYTSDGHAVGPRLMGEELRGLVEAGQAIVVAPCKLVASAGIWVLRRGLPQRDRAVHELRTAGVLVHPPITGPDDSWLCVVDESVAQASVLRDRWRDEAVSRTKRNARNGDWERAEADAERAHQFARGLEAEVLALLSLVYEKRDRTTRAHGVLTMARNSRGAEFEVEVKAALQRLRAELDVCTKEQGTASVLRELLAKQFQRYPKVTQYLGEPRTARLDAA